MNLAVLGWPRVVKGLREGDQTVLLTGLAVLLFQYYRSTRQKRQLVYRKALPVGSSVVVRNSRPGSARLEITKPGQTR